MTKRWKVNVVLDVTYDDIEAETEEEAFLIASEAAMLGGSWTWNIEEVDEVEEDE